MFQFDTVLVGGGLQSALLVLALQRLRPGVRLALVEREPRLGGNHTWCFHAGDVAADVRSWLDPLVVHRWASYEVRFPGFGRSIDREYAAITSERLHEVVTSALAEPGHALRLGMSAASVRPTQVTLEDGTTLDAPLVVDARGIEPGETAPDTGFQKFLGQEIELAGPHGIQRPVLMDATVDQSDGFRFVYVLPFSSTRLLVEDTYFSHDRALDEQLLRSRIEAYLTSRGLEVRSLVREEKGILPMPWREHHEVYRGGPLRAGYRGGFFHPGTGYSLPVAARLAALVASCDPGRLFDGALMAFTRAHRRQTWFCHVLNRMLFRWFPPSQRWHVFRRFYGLPLSTIERFYALDLRAIDRARLVSGRPPRGMSARYRLARGGAS